MSKPPADSTRVFLSISSFETLAVFRRGLFYSYLSIYLRFFLNLSVTETTLFATFSMILNVLSQTFIWGRVSDRFQLRRTLIIVGEISAAIITALVWYLHTQPTGKLAAGYVLIIGLSVAEIFWSMSNVGWSALLSDLYPEKERAGLQGRLQSVAAVGRFAGIWIGGLMYDGFARHYEGWGFEKGALFLIASGVMLISTIPIFFLPEGGIPSAQTTGTHGAAARLSGWRDSFSQVSRRFFVFLIAMVFIYFGINSIILIKSQYLSLDEGFDVSSGTLSYILNAGSVAILIVGLLVKPLSRRFRDEILLICGATVAIVYLLGYVLAGNLSMIFVNEFLLGAAGTVILASSYSHASRLIPPERRGRQFALFNATLFLSWGLPGTLIAGPLVDLLIRSGATQVFSYRMAFLAAALLVVIGVVVFVSHLRMNRGAGEAEAK